MKIFQKYYQITHIPKMIGTLRSQSTADYAWHKNGFELLIRTSTWYLAWQEKLHSMPACLDFSRKMFQFLGSSEQICENLLGITKITYAYKMKHFPRNIKIFYAGAQLFKVVFMHGFATGQGFLIPVRNGWSKRCRFDIFSTLNLSNRYLLDIFSTNHFSLGIDLAQAVAKRPFMNHATLIFRIFEHFAPNHYFLNDHFPSRFLLNASQSLPWHLYSFRAVRWSFITTSVTCRWGSRRAFWRSERGSAVQIACLPQSSAPGYTGDCCDVVGATRREKIKLAFGENIVRTRQQQQHDSGCFAASSSP